jgi:hypothetical protein
MIALEIIGYWAGMGMFMWAIMYSALCFARLCEYITDHLFR